MSCIDSTVLPPRHTAWVESKYPLPLLPDKFQQFACLSCQGKALGVKEAMGKSDSAVKDDSLSQPLQVGLAKAAADLQCPVCLGHIKKTAYVAYCMHSFCFAFIW